MPHDETQQRKAAAARPSGKSGGEASGKVTQPATGRADTIIDDTTDAAVRSSTSASSGQRSAAANWGFRTDGRLRRELVIGVPLLLMAGAGAAATWWWSRTAIDGRQRVAVGDSDGGVHTRTAAQTTASATGGAAETHGATAGNDGFATAAAGKLPEPAGRRPQGDDAATQMAEASDGMPADRNVQLPGAQDPFLEFGTEASTAQTAEEARGSSAPVWPGSESGTSGALRDLEPPRVAAPGPPSSLPQPAGALRESLPLSAGGTAPTDFSAMPAGPLPVAGTASASEKADARPTAADLPPFDGPETLPVAANADAAALAPARGGPREGAERVDRSPPQPADATKSSFAEEEPSAAAAAVTDISPPTGLIPTPDGVAVDEAGQPAQGEPATEAAEIGDGAPAELRLPDGVARLSEANAGGRPLVTGDSSERSAGVHSDNPAAFSGLSHVPAPTPPFGEPNRLPPSEPFPQDREGDPGNGSPASRRIPLMQTRPDEPAFGLGGPGAGDPGSGGGEQAIGEAEPVSTPGSGTTEPRGFGAGAIALQESARARAELQQGGATGTGDAAPPISPWPSGPSMADTHEPAPKATGRGLSGDEPPRNAIAPVPPASNSAAATAAFLPPVDRAGTLGDSTVEDLDAVTVGDPRLEGFRVAPRNRGEAARAGGAPPEERGMPAAALEGGGSGSSTRATADTTGGTVPQPVSRVEGGSTGPWDAGPAASLQPTLDQQPALLPVAAQEPARDSLDRLPSASPEVPARGGPPFEVAPRRVNTVEGGEEYTVQPGDTYWRVSKRVYGTPRYFRVLAEINRQRVPDPQRLRPGTKILTPPVEQLEARRRAAAKPTGRAAGNAEATRQAESPLFVRDGQAYYRVQAGDTLSDIAARYLGSARRWNEILRLNRHVLKNPQDLREGTILRLPSDALPIGVIR